MNYTRVLTVLLAYSLGLLCPSSSNAQNPDYFPVKQGAQWAYTGKSTSGGIPRSIVARVCKVEETSKGLLVQRQFSNDLKEWSNPEELQLSSKGVVRTHLGGKKLDSPVPLIRYPVKEGDTWSAEVVGENQEKAHFTYTVGKFERVTVEAGRFDAIPIVEEIKTKSGTQRTTTWYAAGTGIVKFAIRAGDEVTTMELAAIEKTKP